MIFEDANTSREQETENNDGGQDTQTDELDALSFDFELDDDDKESEEICQECGRQLKDGSNFCNYCGAERGTGTFNPAENNVFTVYGPPITTKYKCRKCGHTWTVCTLGGDDSKYCPMCGKKRIKVLEVEDCF